MKVAVGIPPAHYDRALREPARQLLVASVDEVVWCDGGRPWSDEEKTQTLSDADGYITGWGDSGLTPDIIAAAQRLRVVAVVGSSVARFAPEALFDRGIVLVHTARAIGATVAEFALAGILSLCHNLPFVSRLVDNGEWDKAVSWKAFNLCGKTISLIGCGAVGRHLVRLLEGFRARVLVCDPYVTDYDLEVMGAQRATLERALKEGDVITVHAGATPETRHMMGKDELELVRDGAILVNTARGAIFDEQALAERLRHGTIRALLDVFDREPLPMDSPLRGLPNVLLTPHYAGISEDTFERNGLDAVRDVIAVLEGRPPSHRVTPDMVLRMT